MEIKGKTYKYIFWDWLSTVYDGSTDTLYDWVIPAFAKMSDTNHYLITWTSTVQKRTDQIESSPIRKYFAEVVVMVDNKEVVFKNLIEKNNIPISEILVVGDSYEREIPAAKNLGIDWLHIDDFVREIKEKGW